MVTEWGFSEKLGPILLTAEPNSLRSNTVSHETGKLIDDEVRGFIDSNYQRALQILTDNIDILHAMKDALMKYETIDTDQVDDLMARIVVRPPSDWTEEKSEPVKEDVVEEPAAEKSEEQEVKSEMTPEAEETPIVKAEEKKEDKE